MTNLTKSNLLPTWSIWGEEKLSYFQACLQSGDWSRGQATAEFEQAFAEFCRCKYSLLLNSGFKPHLEKRYRGLWRFENLENCHQAYQEAIRFPHQYLLSSKDDINNLMDNIKTVLCQKT